MGGPSTSAKLLPLLGSAAASQFAAARSTAGAASAAAAAGAGVRVSGGLVSAETGPDGGGLKLYYDKLTLLLDSGLPMGGNIKVDGALLAGCTNATTATSTRRSTRARMCCC